MSAISLGAVLILEDDPGVNRLQCRQLERSGYTVASSVTTEEALEKIQAGGIDLIVLDYNLSGPVSGVEFYRRLQIAGYNLPAILVTGFSDEARLIEALRAGVRDFLPKTADFIEYLAPTVERVMRQVRAERKAIESEELRQKEERFRTSVENMLDCFGIYSAVREGAGQIADFRIDYVNAAATESFRQAGKEQGTRNLRPAQETALERALFEHFVRVVETGSPFSVDGFCLESAGEPARWFDIRVTKLGDGFVATWRDVSARMQAETELARAKLRAEQASLAKDEFLATVSHELRTPLNAILGWAQLLALEDLDAATKADAVLTIERNAKSQARLIEDLIDISRIVSGKLRLDVRALNLCGIIEAALDAARPAANARSLLLEVSLDPLACTISGDPERLQQIVWNLLSNAIKFTPSGGRVGVRVGQVDEGHVEIVVSDSGKGIEPAFLPFVFERFSQAETSSTRHYSGLGLGLAITRHLVELHGGSIEAASEGEDKGATFRVRLPVAAAQSLESEPVEQTTVPAEGAPLLTNLPRDLGGIKVVAVDDDADARFLLQTVLTYCKASATVVATADAAFEAVRRVRPDVLLSDIEMAGEDGYSLIRKVRALGPENGGNTPAAAMTAYARAEDRERALTAGFQVHVSKPVESAELVAVVTRLAGKATG